MRNATPNVLRTLTALSAIFALSIMLVPGVFAQGRQDFTLVNKTGVAIIELYISPHSADDWQEDVLGRDTLPNGESTDVHFSRKEAAAKWDIRIVDEDKKEHKYFNLNLLEISEITVRSNGDGTWHWNWK